MVARHAIPCEMQQAYDCVYAHALNLIDDEIVAPARVLELLQGQLTKSTKTFIEPIGNDAEGEMRTAHT